MMILEEHLMKIIFIKKDLYITLTSGFRLSLVRSLLFSSGTLVVSYVIANEIITLHDFVLMISSTIFSWMIFIKLHMSLTKNEMAMETCESLQTRTSTDKTDPNLLAILALGIWSFILPVQYTLSSTGLYQFVIRAIIYSGLLNCLLYVLQLVVLKHLIVKELKAVRLISNFDELVTTTRKILDLNLALNKSCSFFLMAYELWMLMYLVSMAYVLWEIKEAKLEKSVVIRIFTNTGLFTLAVGLAEFSSRVTDEVEGIKTNIDGSRIVKGSIETNRKLVSAFLLELSHTPAQLSAFGLFKVDRTSVIIAAGTFITYMMVLIQYY